MYPDQGRGANPQPFSFWGDALTTELHQRGPFRNLELFFSRRVCLGAVMCDTDMQDTHPCMCVLMAGMPTLAETSDHTHMYGHGQRVLGEGAVDSGLLG